MCVKSIDLESIKNAQHHVCIIGPRTFYPSASMCILNDLGYSSLIHRDNSLTLILYSEIQSQDQVHLRLPVHTGNLPYDQ